MLCSVGIEPGNTAMNTLNTGSGSDTCITQTRAAVLPGLRARVKRLKVSTSSIDWMNFAPTGPPMPADPARGQMRTREIAKNHGISSVCVVIVYNNQLT